MSTVPFRTELGRALHLYKSFMSGDTTAHERAITRLEKKLRRPPIQWKEYQSRDLHLDIVQRLLRLLAQAPRFFDRHIEDELQLVMPFLKLCLKYYQKEHWLIEAENQELEPSRSTKVNVQSTSKTNDQALLWMVTLVRIAVYWGIGANQAVRYVQQDGLRLLGEAYRFVAAMQHLGVWTGLEGVDDAKK